ncbi:serine hydrolase [Streptomyces sp. NBC_00996]|uniref:serine hydrolase n=1 Tax=Streptomyces sp. NBC_00996 TaxID=2903710 RepID=UPI003870017C|nr:class A beta-lactamase-related serine hydrolase [Streptomyces sp. NBC_00996]
MPHRPSPLPHPQSAGGRRPQGRRAVVSAGVLAASLATLLSAASLDPATAAPASASVRPDAATTDVLALVQLQRKARVTTAVVDLDGTGREPAVYGDDTPYDTASIVKVDILAAALLRAQDAGRALTVQERAQAESMIERSDNTAANALWRRIGLAPGLEAANKRLGLTSTKGGPGAKWGLTRTTASDQIRLLRAVFDTGPTSHASSTALNKASRTYIRTLMTRIVGEQAWGVSAATGSGWALKNGWLQRNTTGLWDVNSVGQVTVSGRHYLVAVLSDGNTSMTNGIALVERAARAAVTSATAH